MKQNKLLLKNLWGIFLLLPLLWGCEEAFIGREKILGTATINNQNYKESTTWAWNFQGYPSHIELSENYKLFYFIAHLSPEKASNPSYSINFYVSEDDTQFKTNHLYIIDFYKEWNIESLYWRDVIRYLSKNKSKIIEENADGIAYAVNSISGKRIPLKGELILESINAQTNVCLGRYSLSSAEDASEKLVINGKFETMSYINNYIY